MSVISFFGPTESQVRAAGGRMDSAGNIHWSLPTIGGSSGSSGSSSGSSAASSVAGAPRAPQISIEEILRGSLGQATQIGETLNQSQSDAWFKALDKVGNWRDPLNTMGDALKKSKSLADELMTGQLPQDVKDAIARSSAEMGISRGVFGQAQKFDTARDLGLTSLDMKMKGAETMASVVTPLAGTLMDKILATKAPTIDFGQVYNTTVGTMTDVAKMNADLKWGEILSKYQAGREDAQMRIAQNTQNQQYSLMQQLLRSQATPRRTTSIM
jgi:hypothetical protein